MIIGEFNLEKGNNFKYLGAVITADSNISEEIKARIQSGNRCTYAYSKLLKSGHATRHTKQWIYKTII